MFEVQTDDFSAVIERTACTALRIVDKSRILALRVRRVSARHHREALARAPVHVLERRKLQYIS